MSRSVSGFVGKTQKQNQQFTSRLSLDSQLCTDVSRDNDMFVFQSGRRLSAEVTGLSMKKLLDSEMSKEISPKKQTPSVVVRLMGVEGLPSPKPLHRHQKNDLISACTSSQIHDPWRLRSSVNQQEFKDVYEDNDALHSLNHRCSPRWNKKSVLAKLDMFPIQQKLFNAEEEILLSDESIQDFVRIPNAPQIDSKSFYGSPIAVLKPLSSEKHESSAKVWRSERHIKHTEGHFLESSDSYRADLFQSSLDEYSDGNVLPTRIVLLKPKQGRIKNSEASCSSASGYQFNYQNGREYSDISGTENSSMTRKVSRQITMRAGAIWDESVDAKSTRFGGYIGDESSYEDSESDTGSDSEIFQSLCRKPLWEGDLYAYPSSLMAGSSNTVARKLNRKLSHKYQGLEVVRTGSTLSEMLASNPTAKTKSSVAGANKQFGRYNSRTFSRIRKHNTSPSSTSSRLKSIRKCSHQAELAEKQQFHNGVVFCDRDNVMKGKLHNKDHFSIVSTLCNEQLAADEAGCLTNANLKIQTKVVSTSAMVNLMPESKPGSKISTSKSCHIPSNHQEKPVVHGSRPSGLSRTEPDSSESSREADHPSPVSVLEVPHREKTTSLCESFERVNTELHELRKQLQLLKMESTRCAEAPPLLPIEEETTSSISDNFFRLQSESWQTSYAADVLTSASLEDSDFITSWHYPNSPLEPNLFQELETKYNNGMMGTKSERKLLFDVIKSALSEILHVHVDSFPWVRPKLYSKSENEAVRNAIDGLICRDFSNLEASENAELDKEMEWSDVEGEINLIGNEMERLLIDEIISELCFLYL